MPKAKLKNAEARIKLLCSLGLDGQLILPTLLNELRSVIPFGSALYARGESGQIVDIYAEHPGIVSAIPDYASVWLKEEAKVMPIISETLQTNGPRLLEEKLLISKKKYYNSEIYNELFIDCEVHHMQCGALRLNGIPTGVLSLYRGRKDPDFSSEHLKIWRRLEGYMAQALSHKSLDLSTMLTESDSALVVLSTNCRVQYTTPNLLKILTFSALSHGQFDTIIHTLCQRINALKVGNTLQGPPSLQHKNAAGIWEFRAFCLDPHSPGDSLIAVTIQHNIPIELKFFHMVSKLNLSAPLARVCLRLMLDETQGQISQKLGISIHTVIEYRRQIYERLNVSSRAELKAKVMNQVNS